jgi:microcystin-dependent protein
MPKISALPPLATLADDDEMPIVDDSTSTTTKFTLGELKALFSPTGIILDYGGTTAPDGWLLCYGQPISRTTYSALFNILGTTYGSGDGSTTFNVPDLRGRVTAGQDDMGGSSANRLTAPINGDTLGAAGGTETVDISHVHSITHTHSAADSTPGGAFNTIGNRNFTGNSGAMSANSTPSTVQPTIILNKIIKY